MRPAAPNPGQFETMPQSIDSFRNFLDVDYQLNNIRAPGGDRFWLNKGQRDVGKIKHPDTLACITGNNE